jgi:hypothetical protein
MIKAGILGGGQWEECCYRLQQIILWKPSFENDLSICTFVSLFCKGDITNFNDVYNFGRDWM